MGGRHSKTSMDVTTTPKKKGLPAEGGDAPAIGDGKLERIEEIDAKPTTNGVAPHIDTPEEKESKDKDSETEKEKDKNAEETKEVEETKVDTQAESPTEGGENVTTPTEETLASPTSVTSPETKESKKKDKPKKKWSFRSISFSKKDKNKPVREETPKNGDVSKAEPLTEGGEDAENPTPAVNGTEEKSTPTSPTESSSTPVEDAKAVEKPAPPLVSSIATTEATPIDDKNEATVETSSSPIAPTPVPTEAKNDEAEKEEVEKKIVEVSPVQAVTVPVEVTTHTQPIVTPSIIERKTSEDFHSLLPSSPPPTPIDPSPLQQAQQAAANADALAEALKLPAETIKQTRNNSYAADDQENSNSIVENNSENIIETQQQEDKIFDKNSVVIPNFNEHVRDKMMRIEKENIDELKINEAIAIETDLVIQTEEGPIPVSDSNSEVKEPKLDVSEVVLVDGSNDENIPRKFSPTIYDVKNDNDLETHVSETIMTEENIHCYKEKPCIDVKKIEDTQPSLPVSAAPQVSTELLRFMTSQINDALPEEVAMYEDAQESIITKPDSPILSPPRTPSPTLNLNYVINDSDAPLVINGHDNDATIDNETEKIISETRLDSVEQNNSKTNNDNTINNLMDRLADTIEKEEENTTPIAACPLTHHIVNNEQSIVEPEVAVENNIVINNNLTETIEEVAKNIIVEAPVSPSSKAPMITEDVASVTKAVEEIDINEKAVAAAVNENIDCITNNEIISEMNHQNNLNE